MLTKIQIYFSLTPCVAVWQTLIMEKIKTTLRIEKDVKKASEAMAVREGLSLQEIVNIALKEYTYKTIKKIPLSKRLKPRPMGAKFKELPREIYYLKDDEINR